MLYTQYRFSDVACGYLIIERYATLCDEGFFIPAIFIGDFTCGFMDCSAGEDAPWSGINVRYYKIFSVDHDGPLSALFPREVLMNSVLMDESPYIDRYLSMLAIGEIPYSAISKGMSI